MRVRSTERKRTYKHRREVLRRRGKREEGAESGQSAPANELPREGREGRNWILDSLPAPAALRPHSSVIKCVWKAALRCSRWDAEKTSRVPRPSERQGENSDGEKGGRTRYSGRCETSFRLCTWMKCARKYSETSS